MITTKKTNNMEEKKEQRKFEFTLYLNDNIIVQRFFNIIGFNNRAINSLNFSTVRNSYKKPYACGVFAQTPTLAQPPLSPERVPNSRPKGIVTSSPAGTSGIFTGSC